MLAPLQPSHKGARPGRDGRAAHWAGRHALAAGPAVREKGNSATGWPCACIRRHVDGTALLGHGRRVRMSTHSHPACAAPHGPRAAHLQTRCPQLRKVSRGAAMHTTQLSGGAAAISRRAASMRRSVTMFLPDEVGLRGEKNCGFINYGVSWQLRHASKVPNMQHAGSWRQPKVEWPAPSPQAWHRSLNQLHQLLQLGQLELPAIKRACTLGFGRMNCKHACLIAGLAAEGEQAHPTCMPPRCPRCSACGRPACRAQHAGRPAPIALPENRTGLGINHEVWAEFRFWHACGMHHAPWRTRGSANNSTRACKSACISSCSALASRSDRRSAAASCWAASASAAAARRLPSS